VGAQAGAEKNFSKKIQGLNQLIFNELVEVYFSVYLKIPFWYLTPKHQVSLVLLQGYPELSLTLLQLFLKITLTVLQNLGKITPNL
jgi:hypothetical protein